MISSSETVISGFRYLHKKDRHTPVILFWLACGALNFFFAHPVKRSIKVGAYLAASSTMVSQLNPLSVLGSWDLWMDIMRREHNSFISFLTYCIRAMTTCFLVFVSRTHSTATEIALPRASRFASPFLEGVSATVLGLA